MFNIFISYRRDDNGDIAGRIYDYLTQPLGPFPTSDVFKDVDSIPLGVHFKNHLEQQMQQCAVCLVVIGPRWADITDAAGRRRFDDPSDFVRIEVESALQRGIPVIPLLVSGATMPDGSKLPTTLSDLPYMNGTRIGRDPDFKPDMARLMRALQHLTQPSVAQISQPPSAIPTSAAPQQENLIIEYHNNYLGQSGKIAIEIRPRFGEIRHWRWAFPSAGDQPIYWGAGTANGGGLGGFMMEVLEGEFSDIGGILMKFVGAGTSLTQSTSAYVVFDQKLPTKLLFSVAKEAYSMEVEWKIVL
ncbi:MAG: toll/interleukin-1 receptor domain-containing protein [Chloroflexota bacterium]